MAVMHLRNRPGDLEIEIETREARSLNGFTRTEFGRKAATTKMNGSRSSSAHHMPLLIHRQVSHCQDGQSKSPD